MTTLNWNLSDTSAAALSDKRLALGRVVTNGWVKGHLIGVSDSGLMARVVDKLGDLHVTELATLRSLRGRPCRVNRYGLVRSDIESMVRSDLGYAREAVSFLFGRQTTDERAERVTTYDNDRGFRKNHALVGTGLAEKSVWSPEDHGKACEVCSWYSGTQLLDREIAVRDAARLGCSVETSEGIAAILADLAAG